MNQRNDATACSPLPTSKASTSIALVFALLYCTFQGAWSFEHDQADIDALIDDFSAGHPTKRYDAQKALREIGRPAVPALGEALASDDPEVRYGAAETLQKIGPDAEAALPALRTALDDEIVRSSVANALAEIGPAAIPYLVDALGDTDRNIRSKAVLVIGSIAEDSGEAGGAVPALITLMRDPSSMGEPDWPADKQGDALMAFFRDQSPAIAESMQGMGKANDMIKGGAAFGSAAERDALMAELDKARRQMMLRAPAFKKAIENSGPRGSLRPNIANTLGDIGAPAVPALLELLGDDDAELRRMSTRAFEEMGEEVNDDFDEPMVIGDEVETVTAGLTHALADGDADVQAGAISALAAFGDASVRPLIAALDDAEAVRRANAAKALGKIEPPAKGAVPSLTAALGDGSVDVRTNAVTALASMGPVASSAAPQISDLLSKDGDAGVRKAAAKALGAVHNEVAMPALVEAFGDDDRHVRRAAGRSLYAFGDTSIPMLVQALGHENERVRTNAEKFLGHFAETSLPALVDALEEALNDDRERVRARSKELLDLINQR